MTDNARKKILFVITKSNFGGAQRYVYDLARSLPSYDIAVACGGEGLLVEKLKALGIRIVSIPSLGRDVNVLKEIVAFFSLASLIRKERPDILHLNSSKVGAMGAVASWIVRSPARVIFTAHAWAFNENRGTLAKIAIAFLHWLTVVLCDETIAVSNAVRGQMLHLPRMAEKITVVHLGIDKPIFYGKKNARDLLQIPEKSFAIGTIAELHPVKGLSYAIDAMRDLPFEKTFTIIGTGDEKKRLQSQIDSSETLKRDVKLAGFIPDAAALLPAFDVFLLPSLSEAFGYVLVEAGFADVPVIATSVGGIPEIVKDMESGVLIHSKSIKEIARAVSFLHDDKAERQRLGNALRERVAKEFSLERMVADTKAVYEAKKSR